MRLLTALPPLLAVVVAQGTTPIPSPSIGLIPSRAPSSIRDVEPLATQSISGPVSTERACAQVASVVANSRLQYPSVSAELAITCLKSVPISRNDATTTIDGIKRMVEFQSTLSYLKDPPKGWPNPQVDIIAGLNDIGSKVGNGQYTNEYDFEEAIASLFIKAHDGHLNFNGMAWAGAFRWRRSSRIALISASRDGVELPKIWTISDFNSTDTSYERSPIKSIQGEDAALYLRKEAELNSYHDPDTAYNAMFFMQPAENFGYFTNPRFFAGTETRIVFENGTAFNYTNSAIVLEPKAWRYISSPSSFYDTYVAPSTSSQRLKPRDPNALPYHLENPRDHVYQSAFSIEHGSVPLFYPRPFIAHTAPEVPLAGYFLNTTLGQIGVLVVQTFNTEDASGARQFQRVIQRYIEGSKARGVAKHIIDVRTNGGGKVLSGYDMYLQFFPSQKPQTQSRYRGHRASEVYGSSLSSFAAPTLANGDLYTSPFSNDAYISSNLTKFADWNAMYPPERFHNDTFTALLKYNLSDPLTTSDSRLAVGIVPTGYGSRNNFTEDPFRGEDLVILTDGLCASTCAIFVELMVQQSRVRTLAVGGRPQKGPMEAVGGTKGTLVLPYQYLLALAAVRTEWASFLPTTFGINVQDASVNFQDNIRVGLEKDGIPSQFLNDSASCRIWYEPQMYLNVTLLWGKTASVAFGGKDGGMNETACVEGSVSTREQQTGAGEGNPGTGQGDKSTNGDKKDAATGLRPELSLVMLFL
ncbi:peptidase S41 family protein-like protein [Ophiobolus disseminans]|uniref:Peptidase S41 family protein-like protein n=1 Tax=Ophiobolus disseminans TaxID=1469910 RepID=A0A6A7A1C1_9PLEO|nr:peptidase S41 family protein-like protein [Ophiobolus disseminans]